MGDLTDTLRGRLAAHSAIRRWVVGYSGGLDSHVLLHALAALKPRAGILALHVHHGLQPQADAWAEHCRAVAAGLGVGFELRKVSVARVAGRSPEEAARAARHAAFAEALGDRDALLLAHHADDQAETVLLHLLRGAGLRGLAGIPAEGPLGGNPLLRPFLEMPREALHEYAREHSLHWIEDPSNADVALDRNFLRAEILPRLRTRWPALAATVGRSARHARAADWRLGEQAEADLGELMNPDGVTLSAAALRQLDAERRNAALRGWIRGRGLPLPETRHLDRLEAELLAARADAAPVLRWPGAELRRYRDAIFLMRPLQPRGSTATIDWPEPAQALELPGGLGRVVLETAAGAGLCMKALRGRRLTVGFRAGGERLRPAGRGHAHHLKALLQEAGIPPWERERLPILFVDGRIAAVSGVCIDEAFAARQGEAALALVRLGPAA